METESLSIQTEHTLETELRESLERCLNKAERARRVAEEAIQDAVAAGQRMIDAEAHFKGRFIAWLKEKFPDTSRQYLNRFQQLAEAVNRGLQLEGHASLRQAFIAAGILPPATRETPGEPVGVTSCAWIASIQKTWDAVQKLKINELGAVDREQLKVRLRPLAELYQTL
jgi:hypothetical protein